MQAASVQSKSTLVTDNRLIQNEIQSELVRLLYVQNRVGLLAEMFAYSIIFIALHSIVNFQYLLLWYLYGILVDLLRFRLSYQYFAANPNHENTKPWLTKFTIGCTAAGLVWSLAGTFLIPTHNLQHQIFLVFMLIGISAGACSFLAPVRSVYTIFICMAFLPFTAWLFLQGTYIYILLGVCGLVFVSMMLGTCFYTHKMLAESLGLRYLNTSLLENLSIAKKQLEDANHDLFAEIQERKQIQTTLQDLATHDTLTKLPNRSLFHARITQAINRAKRYQKKLAVLLIDIDNFKKINNTSGHNTGDKLLIMFGERLKESIHSDDMLARLGGDEFTVLVEDMNNEHEVANMADKLCQALAGKYHCEGVDIFISASIGISFYPNDSDSSETLLKYADIALYRAKEAGKNKVQFYTPTLHTAVLRKQAIENNLRKAVEQNQFVVFYQPFLDLKTNKIIGMEALVRWQHPEHGLIAPIQFIPIAEETGLIIPIGEFVLRTACAQNKIWVADGYPDLEVGINLSSKQLEEKNLAQVINDILVETGLPSHCLNLELTESLAMRDTEYTISTLRVLKELGISLSIDDFGTGYSSLNYLKRLPMDILKIDRSFISDIIKDRDDAVITTAIIGMAHTLNFKVVAEGVETKEQQEFLQSNGCDIMQGYYLSKPMPADEFKFFIDRYKAKSSI